MRAIFLTKFKFPFNDAGSLRYSFMSVLFSNIGYDCYFIGGGNTEYKKWQENKYGKYISLRSRKGLSNYISLFSFEKNIYKVLKQIDIKKNDIVIVAHFFSISITKRIKSLCKKRHAQLLFSVEEKYAKPSINIGIKQYFLSKSEYNKSNNFYKNIKKYGCPVISISSYLTTIAQTNGLSSICIPFVYDPSFFNIVVSKHCGNKIMLAYAGFPGGKDMLYEMMKAIDFANKLTNNKFHLNVFGPDEAWAKKTLSANDYASFSSFVSFNGLFEKQQLLKKISEHDFSILLRSETAEFAMAGFPTKVTESLFCGVPVITNYTSDLSSYLKDMYNSIQVKDDSVDSFTKALLIAANLSGAQISDMKINAHNSFLNCLDVNLFQSLFNSFLKKL